MKHDYRMNWTLPALPLGPAITHQRIEIDIKAMEAAEFETKRYEINGAAQAPRSESVRSDILPSTTPEVAPPFRVGEEWLCRYIDSKEVMAWTGTGWAYAYLYRVHHDVIPNSCVEWTPVRRVA